MGIISQPPKAAAKSALLLMADKERTGQTMFSKRGMYKEVDKILMGAILQATAPQKGDMPTTPEGAKAYEEQFSRHIAGNKIGGGSEG